MSDIINIYKSPSGLVQCTIRSVGCKYKINGSGCIMCDYGADINVTQEELYDSLESEVRPILKNKILLGSYGSILDESEISLELFSILLDFIKSTSVEEVIFETHYKTIIEKNLKYISDSLCGRTVVFEVGLESSNRESIRNIGKDIDLEELKQVINLVHKYNMEISANIILGVPCKCTQGQLLDTLDTIKWSFENKVDTVVIFPVNIKHNTKIYEEYKLGRYNRVYSWLLIELLLNIDKSKLDKVQIAWYGNRECPGLLKPITCDKCKGLLIDFYNSYCKVRDSESRYKLIQDIINKQCKCSTQVIKEVYSITNRNIYE